MPHRDLRHASVVSWFDLGRPHSYRRAPRPALSHVSAACGGLREYQGLEDGGDTNTQQLSFAILPGPQDDQAIRGCSTNADTHAPNWDMPKPYGELSQLRVRCELSDPPQTYKGPSL